MVQYIWISADSFNKMLYIRDRLCWISGVKNRYKIFFQEMFLDGLRPFLRHIRGLIGLRGVEIDEIATMRHPITEILFSP